MSDCHIPNGAFGLQQGRLSDSVIFVLDHVGCIPCNVHWSEALLDAEVYMDFPIVVLANKQRLNLDAWDSVRTQAGVLFSENRDWGEGFIERSGWLVCKGGKWEQLQLDSENLDSAIAALNQWASLAHVEVP